MVVTARGQTATFGAGGGWAAYVVTVRNDGAGTLEGEVRLVAGYGRQMGIYSNYPDYRASVSVPAGAQRTVQFSVLDPPSGYQAQLRDSGGRLLAAATSSGNSSRGGGVAAVLSDVPQAGQSVAGLISSLPSPGGLSVTPLASLPNSAAALSGINALVIDQLDTGALSQAQAQALQDFVALGGALIEVGGASWRRTLLPLPATLLPLTPTSTTIASLAPIASLGGLAASTAGMAQTAAGQVASWAQVTVRSPEGVPLVVEGSYGAGRVVLLTFDPLAGQGVTTLAAQAWGQALDRGLSGAQGAGGGYSGKGVVAMNGTLVTGATLAGSGPGSAMPSQQYLYQLLNQLPAPASPSIGLLLLLLLCYALAVSAVAYVLLRALRRRGLLWGVVPAVAVLTTMVAYLAGTSVLGSTARLSQAQVLRLGPGGVVEAMSYDAVSAPSRGGLQVDLPAGSLLSTAIPYYGVSSGNPAVVTVGAQTEVTFPDAGAWVARPLETLTVSHPVGTSASTMPLEAHLSVRQGRIVGTVANRTPWPISDLEVLSPAGVRTRLAGTLQPGATATVDVALATSSANAGTGFGIPPYIALSNQGSQQALLAAAASTITSQGGDLALVGITRPIGGPRVQGQAVAASGQAAVVEPVRLESADRLAGLGPHARLVASRTDPSGLQVDTYELDLPSGLAGGVTLKGQSTTFGANGLGNVGISIDVYNASTGTWRSVGAGAVATRLTAGETASGTVVARVRESALGQVALAWGDAP